MIPKEFDYVAPGGLEEALRALRDGGEDAKVLAGGHSLIPMMKLRLASPSLLVDLRNVTELHRVRGEGDELDLGSMVTYHDLQSAGDVTANWPLLAECAASIGDAQVRARGTVGGSLAHADPAADLPAAVLALDGVLTTSRLLGTNGDSVVGTREIPARDFFVALLTTALEPGEVLTAIRIPALPARSGYAYVKLRNKASHYALVGAAAVLGLGDDGVCNHASLAITGAAATPFRLNSAEEALRGTRLEGDDLDSAAAMVADQDVEWMSDLFGSEDYRRNMAQVIVARALKTARDRVASG